MATVDVNKLEDLKEKIEALSKFQQVEILKILSKNMCKLNENKSGIFVNMTFLETDVIEEIEKYMSYVEDQADTFQTVEYQKEEFKNIILEHEQPENTIAYRYALRSDAPALKGPSRNFCISMMAQRKLYSRQEIDTKLSNGMGLPVFNYRGGYYKNPTTSRTTPWCRHIWQQTIIRKKQ